MRRLFSGALMLTFLVPAAGVAKTWHVGQDGNTTREALRQVIEGKSADGDTVLVYPGVYNEALVYVAGNKNLVIKSVAGPEKTILDGTGTGVVVVWLAKCTERTLFEGFTVRNGYDTQFGGGVRIGSGSDPVVRGNIIEACQSPWGGGVYIAPKSKALFENNLVRDCIATASGGGLYAQNNGPTVRNNTFIRNTAENSGSGVALFASSAVIENNIFAHHLGPSTVFVMNDKGTPTFGCNAYWRNNAIDLGAAAGVAVPVDKGMKTVDPGFADETGYALAPGSPLKNAGSCGKIGR